MYSLHGEILCSSDFGTLYCRARPVSSLASAKTAARVFSHAQSESRPLLLSTVCGLRYHAQRCAYCTNHTWTDCRGRRVVGGGADRRQVRVVDGRRGYECDDACGYTCCRCNFHRRVLLIFVATCAPLPLESLACTTHASTCDCIEVLTSSHGLKAAKGRQQRRANSAEVCGEGDSPYLIREKALLTHSILRGGVNWGVNT